MADLDEARRNFCEFFGQTAIVSDEVLVGSVTDPDYARHLLAFRDRPDLLEFLLRNPPNSVEPSRTSPVFSTVSLAVRVSKALVKWAQSGFATVEPDIYEHRIRACRSCNHLRNQNQGEATCGICGCFVMKKAWLASEDCPEEHPLDHRLTRWEELRPS